MIKINYRPEIDGLRAIAVGAVILYHAKISMFGGNLLKGGFIGVDVFFVISGYLITSIIFKELVTTGAFSFKNFYERRIRRIIPALSFVMLVSFPFAYAFVLPSELIDFGKSIIYSLGFSSNFYFHFSGADYGAQSGLLKPFLHTWSLSVEEQYYLVFPIILFFLFKYFKNYIFSILIIAILFSLVIADWGSKKYISETFYFIHSRMWELLAGSILAYCEIKLGHRSQNKTLNIIMPGLGLLLIFYSFIFFNDEMYHPSFLSTLPIIGVCLIIWYSNKKELVTKILSTKLFVAIGLISYSLYLWHYPIFAFSRITEFTQGIIERKIFIFVLLFLLSIFSYYFIEKPCRKKVNSFKVIFPILILVYLILFISNYAIVLKKGFQERVPNIIKRSLLINSEKQWMELKNSDGEKCYANLKGCYFNTDSEKKIYLIGDSHAASISYDLKNKVTNKGYQFINLFSVYFPGFDMVNKKTNNISEIHSNKQFIKIRNLLVNENNSILIFFIRYPLYLSEKYFDNEEGGREPVLTYENKFTSLGEFSDIEESFKNSVLDLSKKNKIILIYPIPEVGWRVPNKINSQFFIHKKKFIIDNYITTSEKVYMERTKSSFKLLDSIIGDNIFRIYPHNLFCSTLIENRCLTHDDKNIFYQDDDHPSAIGSILINELIIEEIDKIYRN